MYIDFALNIFIETLHVTAFVLSVLVNGVLLWLLPKVPKKELGTYKYLLMIFTIVDIHYALAHYVILPVPEIYGNSLLMSGHGWISTNPNNVDIFSKPYFIAFLAIGIIFHAFLWGLLCGFFWATDKFAAEYVKPVFDPSFNDTLVEHRLDRIGTYIILVYWERGFLSGPRWKTIIGATLLTLICTSCYWYIFRTGKETLKYIGDHARSARSHQMQHQLQRALFWQAILPLITAYGPLVFCAIMPFYGLGSQSILSGFGAEWFPVFIPPFCAIHPLIDGCITLFTISYFRNLLMNTLHLRRTRNTSRVHPQSPVPETRRSSLDTEEHRRRRSSLRTDEQIQIITKY